MVLPTVGPVTIMTLFTFSSLSTSGIFFALSAPLTTFGPGNMASVSGSACSMILLFARHLNTVSLSLPFKEALVHCVCDTDRRDSRRAAEKRLICFLHFKPLFPYLMRMTASYALCTASAILPLLHASPTVTTYGY